MSKDIRFTPNEMLGQSSLSIDELAELRRRAWVEQGIFMINLSDQRLTIAEALYLRQIAERIYGGLPL